jgi:DNA-binding response OmpR family regulator
MKTVVIADDDSDIRELVKISVTRAGLHVVASVEDGEAAYIAIRDLVPDLAILDVSMPGMTGIEVCRLVRQHEHLASLRIVLLSAAADEASRLSGLAAGANDYQTKPFSPRQLVDILSTINSEAS